MRRLVTALAAVSAFAFAAPAMAADTTITVPVNTTYCAAGCTQTGPNGFAFFSASPNPYLGTGPVVATFGHTGIPTGTFQDFYTFTLGQSGTGSGSVTTSIDLNAIFQGVTDTDFTSVLINGMAATGSYRLQDGVTACFTPGVGGCGSVETFAITGVPITALALNTIEINGISRGLGSYGGQASFTPVPEPATWGLMMLGFGAVGFSMRRSKRRQVALQIA